MIGKEAIKLAQIISAPPDTVNRPRPMSKSHAERVFDFVDRWSADMEGRFEITMSDGNQVLIYDCYPSWDRGNSPEYIWVNCDSPGRPRFSLEPTEIVSIVDVELNYQVVGPEAK